MNEIQVYYNYQMLLAFKKSMYILMQSLSEQGCSYSFNAYYISNWLILPSAGMFLVTAVGK